MVSVAEAHDETLGEIWNLGYAHDQRFERLATRLMLAVVE
jgi:hypothetical protein